VRIATKYELSRIAENGVFIRNKEGKVVFLEGESVVIAIGTRHDNSLYSEISSQGITIYQIGDCLEPRGAKAAIAEGAEIGRAIQDYGQLYLCLCHVGQLFLKSIKKGFNIFLPAGHYVQTLIF